MTGDVAQARGKPHLERTADQVGIAVVILDVLDCGNPERLARRKALYEGFGFLPLLSYEVRLFLPIATIRQLLSEGSQDSSAEKPD